MGKGDKKTRRGKVTAGSYGKTRPRKSGTSKVAAPKVEAKVEKPKTLTIRMDKDQKIYLGKDTYSYDTFADDFVNQSASPLLKRIHFDSFL